jgi:hypothetical protein
LTRLCAGRSSMTSTMAELPLFATDEPIDVADLTRG